MAAAKRSKKPRDANAMAAAIVAEATDDSTSRHEDKRNPHAVALGSLGGKKGGKARAKKLTAAERSQIARKAAQARWKAKR